MPSTLVALRIASAPIFDRPQRGGRVGGEVRIAGAGRKDHDAPLFQMTDGAPPDVRLGDLMHRDRRLHARRHAHALERVLQGERIDDGGQHAHVIGGGAIHAGFFVHLTAPNIAAAHHDRDRNTVAMNLGDLAVP